MKPAPIISFDEFEVLLVHQLIETIALQLHAIVVIEIIETHHSFTPRQQRSREVKADETSGASDEDLSQLTSLS